MEEEERPRKFPKFDHNAVNDDSEPTMTGAVGLVPEDKPEIDLIATTTTVTSDDAQTPVEGTKDASAPKISKRQLKRQQRQEQWEAQRGDRKVKRKEKLMEKKERRRNDIEDAREKGGEEAVNALVKSWGRPSQRRSGKTTQLPLTFILDCGFDDLMLDKERMSLASQITRAYSDNTKSQYRTHFAITSFNKKLKERFDTVMGKTQEGWKGIHIMDEDFVYAADQAKEWMTGPKGGQMMGMFADKTDAKPEDGEVVYLSSDSPHTLTELKPYSTYIIGGLVDKNRHKGVCFRQAEEKGIKTAKLPIGDYIQMASRQILATNHVVDIMLRWLELGDWGKAFMQVLPPRKGGVLRGEPGQSEEPSQRGGSAEMEETRGEEISGDDEEKEEESEV
ncbi:hypothetical protein FE257_000525 [Aspergillus nanangensis]|uniref:tRNA (guanine(9)-N1)-methyltransferase n=1 Tax=Aspergillus nanangensis TaxID=2582783 RepID=A0AAD4GYS6_ASPNN|nr:hypothetical protein FE257_000525 [Aspergillus nanangensis]